MKEKERKEKGNQDSNYETQVQLCPERVVARSKD